MNTFSPDHLLTTFGTFGLIIAIFAESCFAPLPGDSLLFAAGLFASEGKLNLAVIALGTFAAAIVGNQLGYVVGRKVGPGIFRRPDSRFFGKEPLDKTHAYFLHYGPKTVLLSRFIPVVRGFAPIVAGVGRMNYRVFFTYNVLGAFIWTIGFTMGGYALGSTIPNVDRYVLPLVGAVLVISFIPIAVEFLRQRRKVQLASTLGNGHEISSLNGNESDLYLASASLGSEAK